MNPIAFSTLACPDWSIETVIARAVAFSYEGIEWRGGPDGHVRPGMPASQIDALQKASADAGVLAVAVTAYTSFVSRQMEERQANIDELRRYADLAAELDAPYVRAFLGELPNDVILDSSTYDNISDSLQIAAEYAALLKAARFVYRVEVQNHRAEIRLLEIGDAARFYEKQFDILGYAASADHSHGLSFDDAVAHAKAVDGG